MFFPRPQSWFVIASTKTQFLTPGMISPLHKNLSYHTSTVALAEILHTSTKIYFANFHRIQKHSHVGNRHSFKLTNREMHYILRQYMNPNVNSNFDPQSYHKNINILTITCDKCYSSHVNNCVLKAHRDGWLFQPE